MKSYQVVIGTRSPTVESLGEPPVERTDEVINLEADVFTLDQSGAISFWRWVEPDAQVSRLVMAFAPGNWMRVSPNE